MIKKTSGRSEGWVEFRREGSYEGAPRREEDEGSAENCGERSTSVLRVRKDREVWVHRKRMGRLSRGRTKSKLALVKQNPFPRSWKCFLTNGKRRRFRIPLHVSLTSVLGRDWGLWFKQMKVFCWEVCFENNTQRAPTYPFPHVIRLYFTIMWEECSQIRDLKVCHDFSCRVPMSFCQYNYKVAHSCTFLSAFKFMVQIHKISKILHVTHGSRF